MSEKKRATSIEVKAYACGQCGDVHADKSSADTCCVCSKCKRKFEHGCNGFASTCGHCSYGEQLRQARAAVRRYTSDLASAKLRLSDLLAQDRPAKGAPRS